jgi:FlaG/FlaF family flagellin (archaellin)
MLMKELKSVIAPESNAWGAGFVVGFVLVIAIVVVILAA